MVSPVMTYSGKMPEKLTKTSINILGANIPYIGKEISGYV
jgi:hypothetical protein